MSKKKKLKNRRRETDIFCSWKNICTVSSGNEKYNTEINYYLLESENNKKRIHS